MLPSQRSVVKIVFFWLLECCSEGLWKNLTRAAGGTFTVKTEGEVLEAIKIPGVRENAIVARVAFHEKKQDRA